MTFEEVQKELAALECALMDKGVKKPTASMVANSGNKSYGPVSVVLGTEDRSDGYAPFAGTRWTAKFGDTPRKALSVARVYLAAMPPAALACDDAPEAAEAAE